LELADWTKGASCSNHDMQWCATCRPGQPTRRITHAPSSKSRPSSSTRVTGASDRRRPWTEDELDVLIALFFSLNFSAGDDEQGENHIMASSMNRSPSAIDRQWRNIADIHRNKHVSNVGRLVKERLKAHLDGMPDSPGRARETAMKNGWLQLAGWIR
jgi:hypothetical protein